jgi:hypothetical protein
MRLVGSYTGFPMLVLAFACSGRERSHLAAATIDTLPGGIVRVVSPGPTAWADTSGWKLVETLRIAGSIGDSTVINEPMSLALDGEGRVFLADRNPAVIKVFGPDGHLVRTIGREGGGPGEFKVGFIAVHGSSLVVHDPQQLRTSVFDTSGTFVKSWTSLCCFWQQIVVDREGLMYIPGMPPPGSGGMYIRYSIDGTIRDTLLLAPGPEEKRWTFTSGSGKNRSMMSTSVPLSPGLERVVNPAGGFVAGYTERYEIATSPHGQDTTLVFGRAWSPTPISNERRQAIVDSAIQEIAKSWGEKAARDQIKLADVPSSAPAFISIAVDGKGNRWVMVDPGDDSTHTWFDVFDSTGVYLGQVAGPPGLVGWRMIWTDDAMLASIEDADGEPAVVKYEIQRISARR